MRLQKLPLRRVRDIARQDGHQHEVAEQQEHQHPGNDAQRKYGQQRNQRKEQGLHDD